MLKIKANVIIWFLILFLTFSCSGQTIPHFDESNAYNYLLRQCSFGPRNPGSQGHRECLEFLTSELKKYADQVSLQRFLHPIGKEGKPVTMTNIIANFGVAKGRRILLCAHWDTRPWADYDPKPENRDKPILGANDGASGVAILLEVAGIIKANPPKIGVDIILFDGEDSGQEGDPGSWALGSQEFAQHKDFRYMPQYGLLLDLVGDKDLEIYMEENSLRYARDIVNLVWGKAQELGITEFIPSPKYQVIDDHLPLLEVGIPCIDLIDFDYPYWHTLEDTPDKCSPESLGKVGRVVLSLIYD